MPNAPDLRMFLASEIEWETDGQDVEGLPERVVVVCEDAEEVAGILSNDYGWLIADMKLEDVGPEYAPDADKIWPRRH